MTALQIALYALPFALINAYFLRLTGATLHIGKSLSDTESKTGLQDAITPPWSTNATFLAWFASLGLIVFGFYSIGWSGGGSAILTLFVMSGFFTAFMPKVNGEHYRMLIVRSMIKRYADYIKNGDEMRSGAMGVLLEKAGFPVSDLPRSNART